MSASRARHTERARAAPRRRERARRESAIEALRAGLTPVRQVQRATCAFVRSSMTSWIATICALEAFGDRLLARSGAQPSTSRLDDALAAVSFAHMRCRSHTSRCRSHTLHVVRMCWSDRGNFSIFQIFNFVTTQQPLLLRQFQILKNLITLRASSLNNLSS